MQIMNGNMTKNEAFFRKANTKSGKIFEITKNTSLKMLTGKKFVSAHIKINGNHCNKRISADYVIFKFALERILS